MDPAVKMETFSCEFQIMVGGRLVWVMEKKCLPTTSPVILGVR